MKIFLLVFALFAIGSKTASCQGFSEILGRPTDTSVTMSILFDQPVEVYWEYGEVSGDYKQSTPLFMAKKDMVVEVYLTELLPDRKYFYRSRYRAQGASTDYLTGQEHSFYTQRAKGSTYSFAIEADPHLDSNSNPDAYALTLQNILLKSPDFLIDLGDIFMSEKLPVINQTEITNRHLLYRPYFGNVCHSVPLYLAIGNHEGELGWKLDGTANSLPVMAANTRKFYYPNPFPNVFYSGNTKAEEFVGLRENYYAWQWGDALFVVLDPFWYTTKKPGWGWTLGADQYNWFKNVVTTSDARFKFVFCHNLVGGNGNDARGGVEYAGLFEMGGKNPDLTWGFDINRPGWGKPIHNIMVESNTSIFFHGHDHFYGRQEKDGVVYQEVPQPSNKNLTNISATQYGYVDGVFIPGRGYILVTVTDSEAKVDYIKTLLPSEEKVGHHNGEVAYSYTVKSIVETGIGENKAMSIDHLEQNFPNPFDKETTIKYTVSCADFVQLRLYDVFGREVCTLVNQQQQAGIYSVSVDADELSLNSGIYYYKITMGDFSKSMKMIYLN